MVRSIAVLMLFLLASCTGDPARYGLTGPKNTLTPPPAGDFGNNDQPRPDNGTLYGPSIEPTTGNGRYWGYN